MRSSCSRPWPVAAAILVAVAGNGAPAADPPKDDPLRQVEKAREARLDAYAKAKEKLAARLDEEKNIVRTRPLKAEEKVQLIDTLTREKEWLLRHGVLPFSPAARKAAVAYLKDLRAADLPVAAAYDSLIASTLRKKDDKAAAAFADQKKSALAPVAVGTWNLRLPGSNWSDRAVLWSDGKYSDGKQPDGNATWTLDAAKFVMHKKGDPAGPREGWINTCVVSADGRKMDAPNQRGDKIVGDLVAPKE